MTFQHVTVPVLSGHCSFFAHISIHLIVFLLNRLVLQEFIYCFLIIHFYSFEFLFAGIGIFGSSFFTALNDGVTSALISFLRAMVFQVVAVLIFPLLWGVDGIWISMTFADFAAAVVAVICLLTKRKKYRY